MNEISCIELCASPPTESPTSAPTLTTESPTNNPTGNPSIDPTPNPSPSPTRRPTRDDAYQFYFDIRYIIKNISPRLIRYFAENLEMSVDQTRLTIEQSYDNSINLGK